MGSEREIVSVQTVGALVAASEHAIAGATVDGVITSWNAVAERIYGYSERAVVGAPLAMLCVSPEAETELRDAFEQLCQGQTVPPLETIHRRADGTTIDVALTLSSVPGPDRGIAAVAAVARDVSVRKRAERELEQAVADLRDAQRIGLMGSWRVDGDGAWSWSPELCRLLGLDPAEPETTVTTLLDCVHPEDRARVKAAFDRVELGTPFELECRVVAKDGAHRSLHMICRPDPRRPGSVLGTAQDVTELRAIERALRGSRGELVAQRELLAGVFDQAPIGMAIATPEGRFTRVNRALCEILGYDEWELLRMSAQDVAHPDDVTEGRRAAGELLSGEIGTLRTEARVRHREGHAIWVEASASLICDEHGRALHVVAQLADISERKEIERALRAERDRTEAIMAAMGEGILLTVEDRIIEVNDALCALTGFSRRELVGSGLPRPFWPAEAQADYLTLRNRVLESGGDTYDVTLRHKDGTSFEAEMTARTAVQRDGSMIGWVWTLRDVSERKRYEAELERLATHDALTGLANHRLFHQRLGEAMATAVRHDRPLSVAILDLDHFKQINDRHGHVVGDHALIAVAERLLTVVRDGELLARVGGEEFAWVLPDADLDGVFAAAERAREVIRARPFEPVGTLTISIGVATRGNARDASSLYEHGDQALYRAKREGRDRTVPWADGAASPPATTPVVPSPGADG
jgi:diguanylate cyclase (GGDEF)-like protein/PAS domain S-box-containing protein